MAPAWLLVRAALPHSANCNKVCTDGRVDRSLAWRRDDFAGSGRGSNQGRATHENGEIGQVTVGWGPSLRDGWVHLLSCCGVWGAQATFTQLCKAPGAAAAAAPPGAGEMAGRCLRFPPTRRKWGASLAAPNRFFPVMAQPNPRGVRKCPLSLLIPLASSTRQRGGARRWGSGWVADSVESSMHRRPPFRARRPSGAPPAPLGPIGLHYRSGMITFPTWPPFSM
jgi:hypothetical protein